MVRYKIIIMVNILPLYTYRYIGEIDMELSNFNVENSTELSVVNEINIDESIFTDMIDTISNAMNRLGIKLDGTLFRENLFGEKFTTILAGSRSGKGTLTQSLLAPLIASGQPIVYLDNKPDIASLFWDLEDKYRSMGKDVHFLAIDSLAQSSPFIKNEVSAAPRGRVLDENGTIINLNNIPANCPLSNNTLFFVTNPASFSKSLAFSIFCE